MPFKNIEDKRRFDRERVKKRRDQWISLNGPCRLCGSVERLEVDHIDPDQKMSHRIWSWSKERRESELLKCQVLCKKCHVEKTAKDYNYKKHGSNGYDRGCRCRVCTDEAVKRVNEYRWRTGKRKMRSSQVGKAPSC
jgi:hypothetical protein